MQKDDSSGSIAEKDGGTSWLALVQSEQMEDVKSWFSKDFIHRFSHFFRGLTKGETRSLATAALTTLVVLRRYSLPTHDNHGQAHTTIVSKGEEFVQFVSRLLPYSNVSSKIARFDIDLNSYCLTTADKQAVIEGIQEAAAQSITLAATGMSATNTTMRGESGRQRLNSEQAQSEMFKKRIARVLEDQNIARLESLWDEALSAFGSSRATSQDKAIPPTVYSHFLMAFMGLKRPNRAIDIWNEMIQAGITPTVSIWDAMLKGCGMAGDPQGLEGMWERMLASGIKPDAQAWATRIHGLISTGYWESGMRAFREMSAAWILAVQKAYEGSEMPAYALIEDVEDVPKPNTQCFNSLVNGLSRGRKQEQLSQVFYWARNIGVKFDAYTFNPLFRTALRDGDSATASRVLADMQTAGVKPDIATFTMVLGSLFSKENASVSESARHAGITAIFDSMRASGLEANAWSFATLIQGLLRQSNNTTAAHAVLDYMVAESIPRSSQIYTLLISHHFAQETIDIAAVELLWHRARMDRSVALDGLFFDRLIEGLARGGELGRCTTALAQASKRGKAPGYYAMTEVLRALAQAGDWTRVEEIVARVGEEERGRDEIRRRMGRQGFWLLVEQLGVEASGSGPEGTGEEDETEAARGT